MNRRMNLNLSASAMLSAFSLSIWRDWCWASNAAVRGCQTAEWEHKYSARISSWSNQAFARGSQWMMR